MKAQRLGKLVAGDTVEFPLRLAAIDVGSNAIRFIAAEFAGRSRYEVLEQIRSPVRLGHDVFLTGRLAPDALAAAIKALSEYRAALDQQEIQFYRAVATSAVRDSRNGEEFIERAQAIGITLETITGAEEARLAHLAVSHRIDLGDQLWVHADLGGGSVEVSVVDRTGIHWTESHGMGSVRLLEELAVAGDEPGRFRRRLEEYTATLRLPASVNGSLAGFIATGGNIEALARLMDAPTDANGVATIEVDRLHATIEALARLSYADRVSQLNLREDRADVILPAAMVYERLSDLAGMRQILVPFVGVKDGVLLDLAEELLPTDRTRSRLDEIAWASATTLGKRYEFDCAHAHQVARLALALFDQLQQLHGLDAEERRLLLAAAILHDVGTFIGYKRHHKHSQYIIAASEIAGFTPGEIEVVAQIARYHRKSQPSEQHEGYMKLKERERERVRKLAALLRLADAMDREHLQQVQRAVAAVEDKTLRLVIDGNGDLLLERWALQQKAGMFEKVYGLDVYVSE